jgi:hypothetical protein
MTRLLVVADHRIDSQEVCDAIVKRAVAGPVRVTLVASASVGAGPLCTPGTAYGQRLVQMHRRATAERMERAVRQLREAGVAVEAVVGEEDPGPAGSVHDEWDPSRFDEIVVSCLPWLSCMRAVPESGAAGRSPDLHV